MSILNGSRSGRMNVSNGAHLLTRVTKQGKTVTVHIKVREGNWPKTPQVQDRYVKECMTDACISLSYMYGFRDMPYNHYNRNESKWTFKIFVDGKRLETMTTKRIEANKAARKSNPSEFRRRQALNKARKFLTAAELQALGLC